MTHFRPVFFFFSSVLLTFVGGVLGGAPLSVLRQQVGGFPYWLIGLGTAVLFWGMKMPGLTFFFLINVVIVGLLTEVRKTKLSESIQWLSVFLLTFGLTAASLSILTAVFKIDLIANFWARVSEALLLVPDLAKTITNTEVLQQLPSIGGTYIMFCLAATLIMERTFFSWSDEKLPVSYHLSQFRLPEPAIWVLIASMLFAFGNFGLPQAKLWALNIFNIALMAYFFQGLAVVTKYFQAFNVGKFWRVFWYVLIALQLFVLVSVLGVVDYWVDFRKSFTAGKDVLGKNKMKSKLGRGKSRGDSQ